MKTLNNFNGWRRLGVVLVGAWILGCAGLAGYEAMPTTQAFTQGVFVSHSIPAGTLFSGDGTVTLPSGKIVQVETNDRIEKLAKQYGGEVVGGHSGSKLDPWDVDWRKYPEVMSVEYRYGKFLGTALALPAILWVTLEIVVGLAGWVRRGFRNGGVA